MDVLKQIESLWSHIDKLYKGGTTTLSTQEINTLLSIYKHILPGQRLNTSCSDCVKYALAVCASYYEREKPKQVEEKDIQKEEIIENKDSNNITKKGQTSKKKK